MKKNDLYTHTLKCNHSKKTYTIRCYYKGRLYCKYRSFPMGADFTEYWTERDIRYFLAHSNMYYEVRGRYIIK